MFKIIQAKNKGFRNVFDMKISSSKTGLKKYDKSIV